MNTYHCLPPHIIIVSTSTNLEDEINCHRNHPQWINPSCISNHVWSLSLWHWTSHVTHFDQWDKRCKQLLTSVHWAYPLGMLSPCEEICWTLLLSWYPAPNVNKWVRPLGLFSCLMTVILWGTVGETSRRTVQLSLAQVADLWNQGEINGCYFEAEVSKPFLKGPDGT